MKKVCNYFSRTELILWSSSVILIVLSFCIFDRESYLTLIASMIGVTSLIFNAKGNPIGQALMIVFSLLYGVISYTFAYYGEMITYLGMTMPMAVFSLISWIKNPYNAHIARRNLRAFGVVSVAVCVVVVRKFLYPRYRFLSLRKRFSYARDIEVSRIARQML